MRGEEIFLEYGETSYIYIWRTNDNLALNKAQSDNITALIEKVTQNYLVV